ncbi:MAG: OmpW family outer membrane protein [Psychromonas sp.]
MKENSPTNKFLNNAIYLALFTIPSAVFAEEKPSDDSPYEKKPTNSSWEELEIDESFYDNPYRVSLFNAQSGEDSDRLVSQTKSIFGYGFAVMGVLAIMPESVTNWDDSSREQNLGQRWVDNVKAGPVWDRDDWYINLIGHGYFGGVYYQTARKSGYRQWDAFMYSFMMSTFYWEYGIEAFAEIPSIQDLVVTPVIGWAYGEWAFNTERDIWNNGGTVLGSEYLGNTALFALDPVDSLGRNFNAMMGQDIIKAGTGYFTYNQVKAPYGEHVENQVGFTVRYMYGSDDSKALEGISGKRKRTANSRHQNHATDPVDTGIIGFSAGGVYVNTDDSWGLTDDYGYQWSLGLYFTKNFSTRLNYSTADLNDKKTDQKVKYENYGLDAQYYINADSKFRPYATAGIGETMFDESRDDKTFQVNGGLGLHYQLHRKWAIQADWRHYYSTNEKTRENQYSTSLIYRFGKGEWSI